MDKEYHSLNEGIPKSSRIPHIGMDTKQNRNGLHFWIGGKPEHVQDDYYLTSVHLTREDAMNLIEEMRHRLF